MKKITPTLFRLFLLLTFLGAVYYFFTSPYKAVLISKIPNTDNLLSKVKGVTTSISQNEIVNDAASKLNESQDIVEVNSSTTKVTNEFTQKVTEDAKNLANDAAMKLSDQVKDLPKQEAAKIIRQTCDQLITELEKE